jgi:hypothetical protein
VSLLGSASRYSIDSYQEDSATADLTGLWVAIHKGQLNESLDGVSYVVTGSIREIVEVTKSGSTYYLRTCSESENRQVMTVLGNTITVTMNRDLAELTKSSNTLMTGTASHSVTDSTYAGTINMKKVAPLGDSFGVFNYYSADHATNINTASCFQEGSLHIVGTKGLFSQWSDAEMFSAAEWASSDAFQQTSYLYSRAGTAEAVKQLRFRDGSVGVAANVREYPVGSETVNASTQKAEVNAYKSSFSINSVMSGTVDLSFAIASATSSAVTTTTTTSASNTGSGSNINWLWGWIKWPW